MVRSSSLPELALWKAYKRLLLLGNERNGRHGCVNPHVGTARAIFQQDQRAIVKREITWVIDRFDLLRKQTERPKKWNLALQECRDRLATTWHRTVYKRLMCTEHFSHIAYIHALETVLRSRLDAYHTAMAQNGGIPPIRPGGPIYPGQTDYRDRVVRIIVLRPETHYAVDAHGVPIPIEGFHPRRPALGLDPPMGVEVVYLPVGGRFDLYNLLYAWSHHNPLGNRPNPLTIHGQNGFGDPTNPGVVLDYQSIFRPMDFYTWVRGIEDLVGGPHAAWPDDFFPTLRFVLHPAHAQPELHIDLDIIDDHLRKYPTFELWAEGSGIALPLPQPTETPDPQFWLLCRCPPRNDQVLIPQHDINQIRYDPQGMPIVVQVLPLHNRASHVRDKVLKSLHPDSDLTLSGYDDDPNLDQQVYPGQQAPVGVDGALPQQPLSSSDSDGFD